MSVDNTEANKIEASTIRVIAKKARLTDVIVTHRGGGDVEDTCNKEPSICAHTKYRKIRLQRDNLSLGD